MLSSEGWVQGLAEITIIGGITWQVSQDPKVYDTLAGGLIKLGPGILSHSGFSVDLVLYSLADSEYEP